MRLGDRDAAVNRQKFLKNIGIFSTQMVSAQLANKSAIAIVERRSGGRTLPGTDGLITKDKDLYLSITVADCLPIFIFDQKKEALALLHAGWRGLALNITKKAVDKMCRELKCRLEDMQAYIGPSIGLCHFEVKEDVRKVFEKYRNVEQRRGKKIYLDLKKIAKLQLISCGLSKKAVEINPECTYCLSEKYFSFRRDKPEKVEAMMVLAGMR